LTLFLHTREVFFKFSCSTVRPVSIDTCLIEESIFSRFFFLIINFLKWRNLNEKIEGYKKYLVDFKYMHIFFLKKRIFSQEWKNCLNYSHLLNFIKVQTKLSQFTNLIYYPLTVYIFLKA
jgi:hypothetical protein